ncbi:MAG TPA: hypothetical protein VGM56_05080 [Byssovorax sp.]
MDPVEDDAPTVATVVDELAIVDDELLVAKPPDDDEAEALTTRPGFGGVYTAGHGSLVSSGGGAPPAPPAPPAPRIARGWSSGPSIPPTATVCPTDPLVTPIAALLCALETVTPAPTGPAPPTSAAHIGV